MKQLTIKLHWPHNRFAFGWEIYYASEEFPTNELVLFLGIVTLEFEF